MSDEKQTLRLTITRFKGGTWEVSAVRADGSTARRRGLLNYDAAFFGCEDEMEEFYDQIGRPEDAS